MTRCGVINLSYWIVGIAIAVFGVALKRHAGSAHPYHMMAGILIATAGLMIIAFGVSRKRKQRIIAAINAAEDGPDN